MKSTKMVLALPLMLVIGACGSDATGQEAGTIVDVAASAGSFTTLLAAVEAAGLVGVLESEGPFTVFAPTDAAFAALPAGTIDALLADIPALTAVLTYHVVPGRIGAADIVQAGGAQPATVQGQRLTIEIVNGEVLVDGAKVVTADIQASNGVIHVIDAVVLPSATN